VAGVAAEEEEVPAVVVPTAQLVSFKDAIPVQVSHDTLKQQPLSSPNLDVSGLSLQIPLVGDKKSCTSLMFDHVAWLLKCISLLCPSTDS